MRGKKRDLSDVMMAYRYLANSTGKLLCRYSLNDTDKEFLYPLYGMCKSFISEYNKFSKEDQ